MRWARDIRASGHRTAGPRPGPRHRGHLDLTEHLIDAHVDVSATELADNLGVAPFTLRHHLAPQHPLLTRDALLARTVDWPLRLTMCRPGDVPIVMPAMTCDAVEADAVDVLRHIDRSSHCL